MYGKEWLEHLDLKACKEEIKSALAPIEEKYPDIYNRALSQVVRCPVCYQDNIIGLQHQMTNSSPLVQPSQAAGALAQALGNPWLRGL